jgi:TRAP transporter TAXI family solute receptor
MINVKKYLLMITAGVLIANASIAEDEMITIGAGNTVGIYYASSSAIAKLFNYERDVTKQWLVTVASEGSKENINNVLNKQHDFGFAQANSLHKATHGVAPWEGQPHDTLRAVLSLYTEELTIVAAQDAKIYKISDLKGKRINIGAPGSSSQEGGRRLLTNAGISLDDVTILEEPQSRSSDLLANRKIDAYFFMVGHPSMAVRDAGFAKRSVRLIPLEQSMIDAAIAAYPEVHASSISMEYYPKIDNAEAVSTIGVTSIFFTHEDMSEETVYRVVKEVMTHLDLFRRQHPVLADLTAEEMSNVSVVPLHPGAVRYFKETGAHK